MQNGKCLEKTGGMWCLTFFGRLLILHFPPSVLANEITRKESKTHYKRSPVAAAGRRSWQFSLPDLLAFLLWRWRFWTLPTIYLTSFSILLFSPRKTPYVAHDQGRLLSTCQEHRFATLQHCIYQPLELLYICSNCITIIFETIYTKYYFQLLKLNIIQQQPSETEHHEPKLESTQNVRNVQECYFHTLPSDILLPHM